MCGGDGGDCKSCGGAGAIEIPGCARDFVTPDIWEILFAAEQAEHGVWPSAGGWLSQPRSLVDAVRLIGTLRRAWKERSGN